MAQAVSPTSHYGGLSVHTGQSLWDLCWTLGQVPPPPQVLWFCLQIPFHHDSPYSCKYLLCGATVLVELWLPHIFYVRFRDNKFLQGGVVSPTPNPQPGGPVWHLPQNLSGMGDPTSSYAADGIALKSSLAHTSPFTQQQRYSYNTWRINNMPIGGHSSETLSLH
jgi:hypothetical protein